MKPKREPTAGLRWVILASPLANLRGSALSERLAGSASGTSQ